MTATRYKVIETALCIGDSVFDGEVVMVLAADYDRLEQECDRLRNAPCDCGAPVGYVSGDKFQAEHDRLRECRGERDELRAQVEAMRVALEQAAKGIRWLQASVPMSIRISKRASKDFNAAKRAALLTRGERE